MQLHENYFPIYIHAPSGERLHNIVEKFRGITKMQNMAKCIDGCHIPLNEKPDKRKTFVTWDFFK